MIIKITTEREILDKDYDNYIEELQKGGVPINGDDFKKYGRVEIKKNLGYTKATTVYQIVTR
jgi:hypothetical protein